MRKILCTLFLLTAVGFAADSSVVRRVPSFALPDLNATYHDILDLRGKVVVIDLMQTTCAHCQELAPYLDKIQEKYGHRVALLSIVVPPDNAATVREYVTRFHVRYPVLFDCGQATAALLKVTPQQPRINFPHLLVVDQGGMIRADYEWLRDEATLTGDGLTKKIDELLSGKPEPAKAGPRTMPAKLETNK